MSRLLTKDDVVGIFPPVPTPFNADESLDIGALRADLQKLLNIPGLTGLCLGGTTGEGYALTPQELQTIIGVAVEESNGKLPIMAGVIATTTADATLRAKLAGEAGAGAVMLTPPMYQSPRDDDLFGYFNDVYEASGMPYIVYNVLPHLPILLPLMTRLAETPGLIGTKESVGGNLDLLGDMIQTLGDKISVTWAHDWQFFMGAAMGASGSVSGLASTFPRLMVAMFNAIQENNVHLAREIHYILYQIPKYISMRNWVGGNKYVINLTGRPVGKCRRPFGEPVGEQAANLKRAVDQAMAWERANLGVDLAA
ncbi:dihydrodipicolinate synthase family protein [Sphingomonas oryzagri]